MESVFEILRNWNKSVSDREKVQHIYLSIIVVVTIAAGITALLNSELGHDMLLVPLIAGIAFLANALIWALGRVYIFDRLDRKRPTKK